MENTKNTVKATELNVWSLGQLAQGRREFPNRMEPVRAPHIRRCLKAGLVEVVGRETLRLTEAGCKALNVKEGA